MARPGVRSGQIAKSRVGRKKLRKAKGQTRYEGIIVKGGCLGIQARTWRIPPQPANYPFAQSAANAVIRAGKMRTSKAPKGALIWWATGPTSNPTRNNPGHVATGQAKVHCIGNVGYTIQSVEQSYFNSGLRRLGWCYPGDVTGWVDPAKEKRAIKKARKHAKKD